MYFLLLFVSCIWFKKSVYRKDLVDRCSIFVMMICVKSLILIITFFIFWVMWLIPNMMFVCYVFILLEKWIIFAGIQCSSWLKNTDWGACFFILWLRLIMTIRIGVFCCFGFLKKIIVMIWKVISIWCFCLFVCLDVVTGLNVW